MLQYLRKIATLVIVHLRTRRERGEPTSLLFISIAELIDTVEIAEQVTRTHPGVHMVHIRSMDLPRGSSETRRCHAPAYTHWSAGHA